MTFATVYFKHTRFGWKVSYIGNEVFSRSHVNGLARRALFDQDEIAITGNVPAGLREGQFCKRPHKVIQVKEFRK